MENAETSETAEDYPNFWVRSRLMNVRSGFVDIPQFASLKLLGCLGLWRRLR